MPAKNSDLHGNVPDQCSVALLLIDVINDMEFDDGEAFLEHMQRVLDVKTIPSTEIDFTELLESSRADEQHATTSGE